MRGPLLTIVCALLACAPAAQAMPAGFVPEPPAVFPVAHATGYGEWDARYGHFRNGHVHEGQDVFAAEGTPLYAVRDGVVLERGDDGGRGNYVAFYNAAHDETYVYMHMRLPTPREVGEYVATGQRMGSVGCTGSCDGDHLHFEIRRGRGAYGPARDPLPLLKALQAR